MELEKKLIGAVTTPASGGKFFGLPSYGLPKDLFAFEFKDPLFENVHQHIQLFDDGNLRDYEIKSVEEHQGTILVIKLTSRLLQPDKPIEPQLGRNDFLPQRIQRVDKKEWIHHDTGRINALPSTSYPAAFTCLNRTYGYDLLRIGLTSPEYAELKALPDNFFMSAQFTLQKKN